MLKLLQVVVCFSLILTLGSEGKSVFEPKIFSYENLEEPKGLRISIHGEGWEARHVDRFRFDVPFYTQIAADPNTVRGLSARTNLSKEGTAAKLATWTQRLKKGQPTVSMTFLDSQTDKKIGYIEVCVGKYPSVAELGYCFTPEAWEMYAENIFQTMVNQWAPEVNRIGRGVDLRVGDEKIVNSFQCFIGEGQTDSSVSKSLRCVDTFASLAYPRSWEIFDRSGFSSPSVSSENASTLADFQREGMCNKCGLHASEGPWENNKAGVCIKEKGVCRKEEGLSTKEKDLLYTQRLEEEIIRRFYSSQETGLTPGVQYFLVDPDGRLRTFSRHRVTSHICYHFMYAYQS
jgi:hypothetical protein